MPSGGHNPNQVFMVMSNELSTPKVVYCPSDSIRTQPTNFNYSFVGQAINTAAGVQTVQGQSSYFINGNASDNDPQVIVTGDSNIGQATTASGAAGGMFSTVSTTGTPGNGTTGTPYLAAAFLTGVAWNGGTWWSWTANEQHQKTGNLLLGDGSVQSVSISALHTSLANSTNGTSAQYYNFAR